MGKLIIAKNERKSEFFTRETINGLLFTIMDEKGDNVTLLENLDQFEVKISKAVDRKITEKLVNFSLKELHAYIFSNNKPLSEKTFEINRGIEPTGLGVGLFRLPFYFGTNEVLKDGEQLYIEFHNRGYTSYPEINVSVSVETIPSIGLNEFKWFFEKIDLENGKSKYDLDLGNDVYKVVYLPAEGESNADIDIQINSDKLNCDFSTDVLYNQLNNSYEPDTDLQNTPIDLINYGITLNNLQLQLEFHGNATAPDRSIIVARRIVTPQIVNNLVVKTNEHQVENLQHVRQSVKTKCGC
jgi:hypothetical protein